MTSPPGPADEVAGGEPFKRLAERPLLQRTFPVSQHFAGYPRRNLRRDLMAALTVAALAIPSGMAYAELAGMPPVAGLYALLLPAVAYALLGSSRQLIVGPEATVAVLVATAVAPIAGGDPHRYVALASMLALLLALVFAVAHLLRIGWIADYFSRPVLVGYLHGVVVVLIISQLSKLVGVPNDERNPVRQLVHDLAHLDEASALTALVGAISLVFVLALRHWLPRLPSALILLVAGIVVSKAFELSRHGVAVVGPIESGLPSIVWPHAGLGDTLQLVPSALGIFAVSFGDCILTARSFAGRHNDSVNANQELLALAAANLGAGVTQSFPVGASGSRTAVNDQMGGRTQLVGLMAVGVVVAVLLFLTGPIEELPKACLAAVIISAAIGLVSPSQWRALRQAGRNEVIIAAVTTAAVILLGVLEAIGLAVALSILDVVLRSSRPHDAVLGWVERMGRYGDVSVHPSARQTPGVLVYRLDGRLFFADANYFRGRVAEAIAGAPNAVSWFVLDAEAITDVDASGVDALGVLVRTLKDQGIALAVARLNSPLRERFETVGLTDLIGRDRFYWTVHEAVDACAGRKP